MGSLVGHNRAGSALLVPKRPSRLHLTHAARADTRADRVRRAGGAARRMKLNRSALIREALRAHLKNLDIRERELRDRKCYEAGPGDSGDQSAWEAEAIWPEE